DQRSKPAIGCSSWSDMASRMATGHVSHGGFVQHGANEIAAGRTDGWRAYTESDAKRNRETEPLRSNLAVHPCKR
ncbi:MAG: hypothetical protein KDJ12_04715, partial [Hyphomicrobiales bacterium]|nr:hypothetical protein [Hyphomicrobiales bacterium]